MIELPSTDRAWEYENGFYLTCGVERMGKSFAQYESYKAIRDRPGAIVECGVFKGCSLARLAMFRQMLEPHASRRLIAFDTFDEYPETGFHADHEPRRRFIEAAGADSISPDQLMTVLAHKGVAECVDLVAGNIEVTVPAYLDAHPDLAIALLNLDTDTFEPAVTVLEYLYPRIVPGGILLIDDYDTFPGERKAVGDVLGDTVDIRPPILPNGPYYVVKP